MDEKKPWETYESDDPAVKAEKAKTAKIKAMKMAPPPKPKPAPTATSAWQQAAELAHQKKKVARKTALLRPGAEKEDNINAP